MKESVRKILKKPLKDPAGAHLVTFGIGYILIALSWMLFPYQPRQLGLDWTSVVTNQIAAATWLVCGTVAFFTGLVSKAHRRWGFAATQGCAFFMMFMIVTPLFVDVLSGNNYDNYSLDMAIVCGLLWLSSWQAANSPHIGLKLVIEKNDVE